MLAKKGTYGVIRKTQRCLGLEKVDPIRML